MIVIKVNYTTDQPIIKVNYDDSPIYISTTVDATYIKVDYGTGGGSGGAIWGDIIGNLSDQLDLQAALDAKVPYTGATANVDLGEYELKAGQIELDQSPTGTAGVAVTRWNDTIGSTETTLKGGNVILKNGVDLVARVVNKVTPNTTLTKAAYQAVKISGAQGQRLAVALAQANNDNNSADTLGLVTETIPTNQEGFIMTVGSLEGINTTGSLQGETWSDGDVLYLSPTTPGAITKVKPNGSTGHIVVIGYVEYAHQNNGKIYVKIMNGWELSELHDTFISSPANNDALIYESATSLWKNKSIATALGYTPVPSTRSLTINGTAYDLSADRTWSVGTVTSVALSVPTGLVVTGGSPITTSGTIAVGLQSGYSIPTTVKQGNWDDAYTFVSAFPSQTGNSGKYLTTDGSTLSWGTVALTPAGSNTQIQYNNSGAFGASAGFTYDDSIGLLSLTKNQNSYTTLNIKNTTVGLYSRSGFTVESNSGVMSMSKTSSGFGTVGIINSNDSYLYNTGGGNINIINDVSGKIVFAAGGVSTAQMTLTAAGRLLLGTTTESTYLLDVQGTGRFTSTLLVQNSTGNACATFSNSSTQTQYIEIKSDTVYESQVRLNSSTSNYGWSLTQRQGNFYIGSQPDVGAQAKILTINRTNSNVLIQSGTTENYAVATAMFQIDSTTKGFLPPRMTTTQRDAITTPATGLSVYNTTTNTSDFYNGTSWVSLAAGNIYTADGTLTGNRTVTLGTNTLKFTGSGASGLIIENNVGGSAPAMLTLANSGSGSGTGARIAFPWGYIDNTFGNNFVFNARGTDVLYAQTGGISVPTNTINLSSSGTDGLIYHAGSATSTFTLRVGGNINFQNFNSGWDTRMKIFQNTGNVTIQNGGTFADQGYKLDVQGTGRFTGQVTCRTLSNSTGASDYSIELNGISTTDATTRILINCGTLSSTGVGFGARIINATVSNFGVGTFITSNGNSAIGYVANTSSNSLAIPGFAARSNGQSAGGSIGYIWMNGNTQSFFHSIMHDEQLRLYNPTGIIYSILDRTKTNITFGSSTYYASAQLAIDSTTSGFLPPRMTEAQKNAISTPATGLVIYQTDGTEGLYEKTSTTWRLINASGSGGGITRSVNNISTTTTAAAAANTDYVYLISGTTTLTLPTAVGNTNRYTLKNVGTNTVTINTTSSQTIDGSTSITMAVRYTALDVISDGTNWNII